jgi:uncharacterized OB-fold protein
VSPKTPKKEKEEPEEPEVTCPVCGNVVTLDDPFCPHCGAEFEEEEVEEIVEVDEVVEVEEVPEAPEDEEVVEVVEEVEEPAEVEAEEPVLEEPEVEAEKEVEEEAEEEAEEEEEEAPVCAAPGGAAPLDFKTNLLDLRVFGITLLLLGILGTQIAMFVTWYWTWVPPITSNMGIYLIIGIVVIVVGLLAFKLASDRAKAGKKMNPIMPSIIMAIFLFGIIATVMLVAGGPISSAMTGSGQAVMAIVFIVLIVVGILLFMMGMKKASGEQKAAPA